MPGDVHHGILIFVLAYESILHALSDPTRRHLIDLLRAAPQSVGELTRHVSVSQPAVSQHLRALREAGLVERRANGARRIYRIRHEGFTPLRRYVESFWSDVLSAYGQPTTHQGEEP